MPWLLCISYVCTVILVYIVLNVRRRLNIIAATLPLTMLTKASAFELQDDFKINTVKIAPYNFTRVLHQFASDIRSLDIVYLVIVLSVVVVLMIAFGIAVKNAYGRRSFVYLEVLSLSRCIQVRFPQLPDATRHLVVRVPQAVMTVRVHNYYIFGVLSVFLRPPEIVNTLTNQRTLLAKYTLLPPWTTMQLQHLIAAGDYTVSPIIVHTHEYVFMELHGALRKHLSIFRLDVVLTNTLRLY
jgi:hypothetical protein